MTARAVAILFLLAFHSGCLPLTFFQPAEGTESAARAHFSQEMRKWMAGEENEASTMRSRLIGTLPPIGFDIRSVVPDQPDPLAFASGQTLPENWRDWPAYRFNVSIEFKSQSGSPLEKVATYTLTWNQPEHRWYVTERTL